MEGGHRGASLEGTTYQATKDGHSRSFRKTLDMGHLLLVEVLKEQEEDNSRCEGPYLPLEKQRL